MYCFIVTKTEHFTIRHGSMVPITRIVPVSQSRSSCPQLVDVLETATSSRAFFSVIRLHYANFSSQQYLLSQTSKKVSLSLSLPFLHFSSHRKSLLFGGGETGIFGFEKQISDMNDARGFHTFYFHGRSVCVCVRCQLCNLQI